MNNELFTVHPRTGNLQPSEVTTITFSFKSASVTTPALVTNGFLLQTQTVW